MQGGHQTDSMHLRVLLTCTNVTTYPKHAVETSQVARMTPSREFMSENLGRGRKDTSPEKDMLRICGTE